MKLPLIDINGTAQGQVVLPSQFDELVRPDIILRAVLALHNNQRHHYGAHPGAGLRAQGKLSRRRRDYKTSYGHGISRVPRKILSRRGLRMYWVGAVAPGMVKGRRAHAAKASKNWDEKVNKKENQKAIRSALAATVVKELVVQRGHHVPSTYPFVVDVKIEEIKKSNDVAALLQRLGFEDELTRSAKKKIRAGRGKNRGRPYKKKKGLLIVVSGDCALLSAARNIPGVDVVCARELNAELLAPGALPGRVTLWSAKALELIEQERLFV